MLAGIRAYLPLFLSLTHLPDSLFFQSCLLHEAGIIASSMLTSFQIHQQRRKGLQSPLLDLMPRLCRWEQSQGRTLMGLTRVPCLRTGRSPGHSCVVGDGGEVEFDHLFQNYITERRGESPPKWFWICSYQKKWKWEWERKKENGKYCLLGEAYVEWEDSLRERTRDFT